MQKKPEIPYRVPAVPDEQKPLALNVENASKILEMNQREIYELPFEVFWAKISPAISQEIANKNFSQISDLEKVYQIIVNEILPEYVEKIKELPKAYKELLFVNVLLQNTNYQELFSKNGKLEFTEKINNIITLFNQQLDIASEHSHFDDPEDIKLMVRNSIYHCVPDEILNQTFYPNRLSRQPLEETVLSEEELKELLIYCIKNEKDYPEGYDFTWSFSEIIRHQKILESIRPEAQKVVRNGIMKLTLPISFLEGILLIYEKFGFEAFVISEALTAIALTVMYLIYFAVDDKILDRIRKSKSKPLSSEKLELLAGLIQKRNSINRFKTSHSYNQKDLIDSALRLLLTGEFKTTDLLVDGQIDFSKVLDRIKPDLSYPENLRRRVKVETHEIIDAEFEEQEEQPEPRFATIQIK